MGKKFPCILVGNKIDLVYNRQVSKKKGKLLAELWDCPFYEISVKD